MKTVTKFFHHNEGGYMMYGAELFTGILNEVGSIRHYKNGSLHNENGPAYETTSGIVQFMINGKPHRVGGPALIEHDGNTTRQHYYQNGKLYREDDLPTFEVCDNGIIFLKLWLIGNYGGEHISHRVNGPSEIDEAGYSYSMNGSDHREDGPARKSMAENGSLYITYAFNGIDKLSFHAHGLQESVNNKIEAEMTSIWLKISQELKMLGVLDR